MKYSIGQYAEYKLNSTGFYQNYKLPAGKLLTGKIIEAKHSYFDAYAVNSYAILSPSIRSEGIFVYEKEIIRVWRECIFCEAKILAKDLLCPNCLQSVYYEI